MLRNTSLLGAALVVSLSACAPPESALPEKASISQGIYYGTRDPQNVTLSEGQKLAIGWFFTPGSPADAWCSGTLISSRVVASADHCLQGVSNLNQVGFGVGTMPTSPTATFTISGVHRHQSQDAALFVLSESATARVPSLVPIPANRVNPSTWLNQQLDAAGYGQTHDGSIGRYFASVWLERVMASTVEVNGRGQQGICFGDSGGPLLAPGPVVVAVESYGDANCVGKDTMVRLDALASWIDPILAAQGEVPDECDGLDYLGRCNGHIAEWCTQDGQLAQYDCSTDGMTCGYVDDQVGYYCVEQGQDPCGGLDYLGRCNGDIAEWCQDGQIRQYDCSTDGMTCGYINDQIGHYCVDPGSQDDCGGLDYLGRCDGQVAEWCEEGQIHRYDCALVGLVCEYVDSEIGYYCVDPDDDGGSSNGNGNGGGGGGGGDEDDSGSGFGGCSSTSSPSGPFVLGLTLFGLLVVLRRRKKS